MIQLRKFKVQNSPKNKFQDFIPHLTISTIFFEFSDDFVRIDFDLFLQLKFQIECSRFTLYAYMYGEDN